MLIGTIRLVSQLEVMMTPLSKLATLALSFAIISSGLATAPDASSRSNYCRRDAQHYADGKVGGNVVGGAVLGAALGAGVGAIAGGLSVGTGAAIGGGVGAVGGAVRGSDRWNHYYNKRYYNCMHS